jgi:hypothetical protein
MVGLEEAIIQRMRKMVTGGYNTMIAQFAQLLKNPLKAQEPICFFIGAKEDSILYDV